jgi:hypothetical protein
MHSDYCAKMLGQNHFADPNWHVSTSNFDVQGRTLSSANDALIIIIAVIEVVVLVLESSCIKYSRS